MAQKKNTSKKKPNNKKKYKIDYNRLVPSVVSIAVIIGIAIFIIISANDTTNTNAKSVQGKPISTQHKTETIQSGAVSVGNGKTFIVASDEQISYALKNKSSLSQKKQQVIDSALSLIGKVHYFWGGKSEAIGWDNRWGNMTTVTSSGSSTSGSEKPFGLDCSGFITWCFIQTGMTPDEVYETVGNGTWNQWDKSQPIEWSELQPGDFAFQRPYPTSEGNHIGICIGYDDKNKPLFVHCSLGLDNVYVTYADDIFTVARRPNIFS